MKIGSVQLESPVILAPMAGVTDFPFRKIVKNFGAGLVVSEMIASRAVLEATKNAAVRSRMHFFDSSREEIPIAIQVVGYDADVMAEAAKFNEQLGVSIIDINMGCPVRKVVNVDSGAALMRNESLAAEIIGAVVRAVSIPVTVKMRLGWDCHSINAHKIAKIAECEGASAVTVHGRTRAQFYEGNADWTAIGVVKRAVSIPVIGNGDVFSPDDAGKLLSSSGADAVMIGRGACGRPWFLKQVAAHLMSAECKITVTLYETIMTHMDLIASTYGEQKGILIARKHLGWYSKGMFGATEFRTAVNSAETKDGLYDLIKRFFGGNSDRLLS
jgi:tRNA-dihydrouridine synthase B